MYPHKAISHDFSIRYCVLCWLSEYSPIHEVGTLQFFRFGFYLVSTLIGDDQTHCSAVCFVEPTEYTNTNQKNTGQNNQSGYFANTMQGLHLRLFFLVFFFVSTRFTKELYSLKLTTNKNLGVWCELVWRRRRVASKWTIRS